MAVLKLVGVSFDNEDGSSRQEILCRIYDRLWTEGREDELVLELRPEHDNPYDPHAVGVHVVGPSGFEGQVGYVPADAASAVRVALASGVVGRVRFRELRAGRRGSVSATIGLGRRSPTGPTT